MEDKNRKITILFVLIGLLAGLSVGGVLVVTRTIGITQDKAMYFQSTGYFSQFEVFENNAATPKYLTFKSEIASGNIYTATTKYNNVEKTASVDTNGILQDSLKDSYLFLWWEEETMNLTTNYNGNGLAIISSPSVRFIRDPFNLFLNSSVKYKAVCTSALVYLKGRFATQASYNYIIQRVSDGRVVGDAIIDMTSGIPFEFNLYEEGYTSVHIVLESTTFPISRNRERLLTSASIVLPITFVLLYLFLKKKRGVEGDEMKDCLLLGGIGLYAFWLDQFIDFWHTYTIIMPLVLVLHLVPIILILVFKRELWHYIFIPLVELAIYGFFVFFNMGIFVLWLAYGNVSLWLALGAHFAFTDKKKE